MQVLLVTSRDPFCGISCHSDMLMDAVTKADQTIQFTASAEALDPNVADAMTGFDLIHLNHQASLHSRWSPHWIHLLRNRGVKVIATVHDTGVPNSDQCKAIVNACDAAVVHEPFDDLPAEKTHYWPQGVPQHDGRTGYQSWLMKSGPVIGSMGHDFPWKNYDLLCELAGELGWGVHLYVPTAMTLQREGELKHKARSRLIVFAGVEREYVIAGLSECDATAFLYVTNNTGTSGAIRFGIAAKKPVLAFATCRQFRDLVEDMDLGITAIRWCQTVEDVRAKLETLRLTRFDPLVVKLAERDSWTHLGRNYAELYQRIGGVR